MTIIRGSGGALGGGGKGGNASASNSPREAPNSLQSLDYIRILSVISEGQIAGFVSADPLNDIYLDKTPIKSANGTVNFENFTTDYRYGTVSQSPIPGFNSIENIQEVNAEIRADLSVTRTIADSLTDAIRVILSVNSFQEIAESGDVIPVKVDFAFDLSTGGGPFVNFYNDSFNGKSSGGYRRSYVFAVAPPGPWSVRIRRLTPDRDSSRFSDKLIWSSITSVNWTGQGYDNTAIFGANFSAKTFNSVPEVALRLRGIQVKIPHNYNAIAKTYSGIFNGTLTIGYSNNPAWVLYDILTDTRYGMGLPEETLDVYSFYDAGVYSDQLVPNGVGGFEPRFTFNAYVTRSGSAYDILRSILGSFNCQLYLENGSVTLVQDRPKDPIYMFNDSNVIVEEDEEGNLTKPPFSYETTAENTRYNAVLVTWDDPNEFYESKTVLVQDINDINTHGYNPTEITAFGCTNKAEAIRFGRWTLFTSLLQTKTVSFSVGKDGLYTRPGDIVLIKDKMRSQQRLGGRILLSHKLFSSPDIYYIKLDSEISFVDTKVYEFQYVNAEKQIITEPIVIPNLEEALETSEIYLQSDTPINIIGGSYWLINIANENDAAQYRILNVSEDPDSEGTKYNITAVEHLPEKYNLIETFTQSDLDLSITTSYPDPNPPENLIVTEALYTTSSSSGVRVKMNITWSAPIGEVGLRGYELAWRRSPSHDGRNFNSWTSASTPDTFYEFYDVDAGLYEIQVLSVNIFGKKSKLNRTSQIIYGLTAKPSNVTGFSLSTQNSREGQAVLTWDTSPDLDVLVNGSFIIKHYQTLSDDWNKGIIISTVAGGSTSATVPLLNGTYAIKAEDSTGNRSRAAAFVNTEFAGLSQLNNLVSFEEYPAFTGNKTNIYADNDENFIELQDTSTIDFYVGLVDEILDWDIELTAGSFASSGIYEFDNVVDLGGVFNALVSLTFDSFVYTFDDLIDSFTLSIDSLLVFIDDLGEPNDEAFSVAQIALSNNNIDYTPWADFYSGYYKARYFKFRMLFFTSDSSVNVRVARIGATIDVPDAEAQGTATTSAFSAINITLPTNRFYTTPQIFVTINNFQIGDRHEITSVTPAGFSLSVFNGASRVARTVNWIAKGY